MPGYGDLNSGLAGGGGLSLTGACGAATPAGRAAGRRPDLRLLQGCGDSMSRTNDKSVAYGSSFVGDACGVDTVRFRFREQPEAWHNFRQNPHAVHARGELRVVTEGRTIGLYPDGHAYVEARLSNLI